jgi:DnaJ-domain-containing protein 1
MSNAYDVLGVPIGADRGEIRAAYIDLAKRLHPDRNTGSVQAEQRLRDINQAYALLKDPEKRSTYDQLLQQSRGRARQQHKRAAAVMAASFALTTAIAGTLLFFARLSPVADAMNASEYSEPVRPVEVASFAFASTSSAIATEMAGGSGKPQMDLPAQETLQEPSPRPDAAEVAEGRALQLETLQASTLTSWAPADPALRHTWSTHHNDRFGFALDYPADLLVADDRPLGDFWRLFVSRDGQARLLVTAGFNGRRLTPATYRQSMVDGVYRGASLEYAPLRKTWFVLAGSSGADMFYERVTFACDGRIIHRWRLTYPASERDHYSLVIERMHQGYKHIRGTGSHCG